MPIGASIHDQDTFGRPDLPCLFEAKEFVNDEDLTEFTSTTTGGGAAPAKLAASANGVVRFSGAATTNNSGSQIQLESTPIRLDRQDSFFAVEARIKLNDVKGQIAFGVSDVNADIVGTAITDGIVIKKASGAAGAWSLAVNRSAGLTIPLAIGSLITDLNWHVLTLRYDSAPGSKIGQGNLKILVDGNQVHEFDVEFNGGVPYDDNLTPSLGFKSGDALGTQTMDLDFFRFKSTRSRV